MQFGSIILLGYEVNAWLILGFAAQGLFFMRFIIQWLATEKAKRTMLPISFWYFSIGGSALLLVYAVHRDDPVFILGCILSMLIYFRNLYFARRNPNPPAL